MTDFLDLAAKAKELGLSLPTLRARIMSEKDNCFILLAQRQVLATIGESLPPWSLDLFPFVRWSEGAPTYDSRGMTYWIRGWVGISPVSVEKILTTGKSEVNATSLFVVDEEYNAICELRAFGEPKKKWVKTTPYEGGGYFIETPEYFTTDHLHMRADVEEKVSAEPRPIKGSSLLAIIEAMRKLLQDEDRGDCSTNAKIIDHLTNRFRTTGVSKRTVEEAFARAKRTAQDAN